MTMENAVSRLRRALRDFVDENILEQVEESSDPYLEEAIEDTIDEINFEFPPYTEWTIAQVNTSGNPLTWNLVKKGAILNVLTSVGILSARNTLTYNDTGGVTVQDYDKYGRYVNWFNVLIRKYIDGARRMKMAYNTNQVYDTIDSEWRDLYDGGGNYRYW